MFKIVCLIALFAVANAQLWPWPQPEPEPQPIAPEFNPPLQRPRPPVQDQIQRAGARDTRCPRLNGPMATVFPHDSNCSQFYMCNDGVACKKKQNW